MPSDIQDDAIVNEFRELLQRVPSHCYVLENGLAAFMLGGPNLDKVLCVVAPEDRTFNEMTDEEVNQTITDYLKAVN